MTCPKHMFPFLHQLTCSCHLFFTGHWDHLHPFLSPTVGKGQEAWHALGGRCFSMPKDACLPPSGGLLALTATGRFKSRPWGISLGLTGEILLPAEGLGAERCGGGEPWANSGR